MKTRTQSVIIAGTLTGLLLILVLALTSVNYLFALRNDIKTVNQRDLAKVVILHKMSHVVRERSLRMYAMYFSQDIWQRDAEYQRFHALALEFITLRDQLLSLGLQPTEMNIWNRALAIIRVTEPLQESIVEKLYVGHDDKVGEQIALNDLPRENELLKLFDDLLGSVQDGTQKAVQNSEHKFVSAIELLLLLTVGVITLSLTNMFFLRKRILETEATLHEEKELAQLTLQNIIDGVIKTNRVGEIVSVNSSALHITDMTSRQAIGRQIGEVLRIRDTISGEMLEWVSFLADLSGTIMPLQRYFELVLSSGKISLIEISISPIFTAEGRLMEFAFIFRDVTSEKKQADAVSWQATHDPLTQVLNRNAIISAIQEAVITARQHQQQHILFYIDLDDFKHVNDHFGHVVGDELLMGICRSFEQCVRKGDRIARMGGDEFAILLTECDLAHAVNIAEKIRHNVSRYCLEVDAKQVCCGGLSIGISIINADTNDWKNVIEEADKACYNAKREGKNQVCVA